MPKKKKLKLNELNVKSFTTNDVGLKGGASYIGCYKSDGGCNTSHQGKGWCASYGVTNCEMCDDFPSWISCLKCSSDD